MELLFFYIFAGVAIVSAMMVVMNKNVLHAALFLILTFFCVAAIYIILRAEFLAAVQVLLYVGAIMALFIFTVLLINVMQAQFLRQFHGQRPLAAILVVALLAETIFLLFSDFRGSFPLMQETPPETVGRAGLETVSQLLLTDYLLVFEVASVLLLAALIGAVVLARGDIAPADRRQ
ncbi:MAG: NADH-quinone oxidoreductase subunit J family protein [Candidatus Entotheonellia bacterium]|jgi:NADH-quinone oxidoreductase subunit J